MNYDFKTGIELVKLCDAEDIKISEVMIRREMDISETAREDVIAEMRSSLYVMRESSEKGLTEKV